MNTNTHGSNTTDKNLSPIEGWIFILLVCAFTIFPVHYVITAPGKEVVSEKWLGNVARVEYPHPYVEYDLYRIFPFLQSRSNAKTAMILHTRSGPIHLLTEFSVPISSKATIVELRNGKKLFCVGERIGLTRYSCVGLDQLSHAEAPTGAAIAKQHLGK